MAIIIHELQQNGNFKQTLYNITYFILFSSDSIGDFEQLNVSCVITQRVEVLTHFRESTSKTVTQYVFLKTISRSFGFTVLNLHHYE